MKYTENELRTLFQSKFNGDTWQDLLIQLFQANELRQNPEIIREENEIGYFLGSIDTEDYYKIGLFHYEIKEGSVANKRVGLRNLVKSFINPNWGEFDAALVVFDSGDHWRLSFICDIKGENTTPKRYTFVFGDNNFLYKTAIDRFLQLQSKGISFANLKDAFSVEALTKEFYNELFEWYQWAISPAMGITFPNNTGTDVDDRDNIDVKIIRLITRIMFVWFIKQKNLVPNHLFDEGELSNILQNFNPKSQADGCYYNAILQNLFFATLNRAIVDEANNKRGFAKALNSRDVKNLYRYSEMFAISEDEVIQLFSSVPFLNGGLFECLDKTKTIDGVEKAYNIDGFSRNSNTFANGRPKYRAFIPNILFFHAEKGLFSILNRYNFTVEENTPTESK